MTIHTFLPEEKMIERAIEALVQALGPIETARFRAFPRASPTPTPRLHRMASPMAGESRH